MNVDQWSTFVQTATDTAHNSDLADSLGHRDGFCIACAEVYRAINVAAIAIGGLIREDPKPPRYKSESDECF